jgi:hypothetical protein
MDYILEQHNLATVQFLALLAIHSQRSPYGAGAWSQMRYAMTLCIELGLHRKRTLTATNPGASTTVVRRDLEIRRRCFWACYCLDRTTSLLLGRTFAIADRDINVEFPSASPEYRDLTSFPSPPSSTASSPQSAAAGETQNEDCPSEWSNVLPFIHIIRLRKIQSKIHRTVFRVDRDIFTAHDTPARARLDAKVAALQSDLDEWARTIPSPPKDARCATWMYDPDSAYHHNSRDFFIL